MGFKVTATGDGMHSHDRTMIARLGFADPDKGDSEHELACQFLVQPDVAVQIGAMRRPTEPVAKDVEVHRHQHLCPRAWSGKGHVAKQESVEVSRENEYRFSGYRLEQGSVERPIGKGDGQYRTTIGFMDVVLAFEAIYSLAAVGQASGKCSRCDEVFSGAVCMGDSRPKDELSRPSWQAIIEVKIGRVPISDVIRQIGFYREYADCSNRYWFLASPWGLNPHEMKLLNDRGIRHLLLGARFDEFCEESKSLPSAESALTL